MAIEHFKAKEKVHETMKNVWSEMVEENISLGLLDPDEIVILMREGELPPNWGLNPGKIKKVTKDLPLLTDKNYNYKYVMEIVASVYNSMSDFRREALFFHLLSFIEVVENENSGEVAYRLKKPPIVAFPEEIKKYKFWWPEHDAKDSLIEALEKIKQE